MSQVYNFSFQNWWNAGDAVLERVDSFHFKLLIIMKYYLNSHYTYRLKSNFTQNRKKSLFIQKRWVSMESTPTRKATKCVRIRCKRNKIMLYIMFVIISRVHPQ